MDNSKSSRGRGRPPTEIPTMPVFLGATRSRKQMQVVMSGPVARELELYVDWASGIAMMSDDEVFIRVMDHALSEFFRSDRKWQKEKADFMAAEAGQVHAPPQAAPAAKAETNGTAGLSQPADKTSRPPLPNGAQKAI